MRDDLVARLRRDRWKVSDADCEDAADEIERLREALKAANASTEHFERNWYLHGDEIERLTAERDAIKADAERYRWLRAEHERFDPMASVVWKYRFDRKSPEWVNCSSAGALDDGIDAALKENSDE